jgi:hypothetical protein
MNDSLRRSFPTPVLHLVAASKLKTIYILIVFSSIRHPFSKQLGLSTFWCGVPRQRDFNWEGMVFPVCDLSCLGDPFDEEEVLPVIKPLPSDKAPGPDGYSGAVFKACWSTIIHGVTRVIQFFSNLHADNFHWLNSTNIELLPKKDGVEGL